MVQKEISRQKKFGRILKTLLNNRGLTQEQFAEMINSNPRTVGRWIQNGIDKVSILEYIAEIFGMDLKDVMFPKN